MLKINLQGLKGLLFSKREAAQKKMQSIREEYNVMAQERAMRMQEMDKKKAIIEQIEKKVTPPKS